MITRIRLSLAGALLGVVLSGLFNVHGHWITVMAVSGFALVFWWLGKEKANVTNPQKPPTTTALDGTER